MSLNKNILFVLVPRGFDGKHIFDSIPKEGFDVVAFVHNKHVLRDELVQSMKNSNATIVNYNNRTMHFSNPWIWIQMKKHIKLYHSRAMFVKSNQFSLVLELFDDSNNEREIILTIDAANNTIREFMFTNSNLITNYNIDVDNPLGKFTEINKDKMSVMVNFATQELSEPYPIWLYIEITTLCNLNCSYCTRLIQPVKDSIMPYETFVSILDKFPDIIGVNIIGLGEPMMHPQFKDIINEIGRRGLMLTYTTNGTIIDEEIIKNLPPQTSIYVSLDGVTKDNVMASGRKVDPSIVMNTIKMIREIRPNIRITLQPVVLNGFEKEVRKYIEFANSLGLEIHATVPVLTDKDDWDKMHPTDDIVWTIDTLLSTYSKYSKNISHIPVYRDCTDPYSIMLILINGDVYPCCYINTVRVNQKEYYNGNTAVIKADQYKLGNIITDDVYSILNSKVLIDVRHHIATTNNNDFDKRGNLDTDTDPFNYCKLCLGRWKRGC
jgi:MoaA/NifB/PqqE/SkfB family radical SAM enzyme